MFVIRPILKRDLDQLEKVAFRVSMGLLNLPKHPGRLHELLERSLESFAKEATKPRNEFYLFVLENTETGEIGGTCGIFSKTSVAYPTFHYKITTRHPQSDKVPVNPEIHLLEPVSHINGPSEMVALYLLSEWRAYGLGKLLSLSRFMFIASEPERFDPEVISHIRGHFDRNGVSPFWESVGRHFLDLDYREVLTMLEKDYSFVADIVPEHPIYAALLPEEAQECIGKTHKFSKAALNILVSEGFKFSGEIDLFDGGPKLTCPTNQVRTIKESRTANIGNITHEPVASEEYLISNDSLHFRCCLGNILMHENDTVSLTKEVAEALELNIGDGIRYSLSTPVSNKETV